MHDWLPYLLTCFAITASPGPGSLLTLTVAAQAGVRAAAASIAGMLGGVTVYMLLVLAGAGLALAAAPALAPGLAVFGGVYLVWLGAKVWRAGGRPTPTRAAATPGQETDGALSGYALRALGVSLGNAKLVVLMVALLPPYLAPGRPWAPQAAGLVFGYLAVAGGWHMLLALFGGALGAAIRSPRGARGLAGVSAALFVLFGLLMALEGLRGLVAQMRPA
jgi:threonine/homoserine/homoserine lactone efflux protein